MGVSEKIIEALRSGILLNDRVSGLITKVDRIDQDIRKINDRVVRLETMVEIGKTQSQRAIGSK